MKHFLNELGEDPQPWAKLALFGKHPAWSDHMEDFGIDTQTLAQFKQWLYVEGIGKQLSSGRWERLSRKGGSIDFGHLFVWQRGHEFLIGHLEASEDRKGRGQYPIVLVAHGKGWPIGRALERLEPIFSDLIQRLRSASEPDQVRRWYQEGVESLNRTLDQNSSAPNDAVNPATRRRAWIDAKAWGNEKQGLCRVAHAANSAWANDVYASLTLRVAPGTSPIEAALECWIEFLQSLSGENHPLFISRANGQDSFDILMGDPGAEPFFFLKAGTSEIASTTETPFTIADEFKERVRDHCEGFVTQGSQMLPLIARKRQGFNPFGFLSRRNRDNATFKS